MAREKKSETIRVRSTMDLKERIDRIAKKRGCDASDVIREALIRFADTAEQATRIVDESSELAERGAAL